MLFVCEQTRAAAGIVQQAKEVNCTPHHQSSGTPRSTQQETTSQNQLRTQQVNITQYILSIDIALSSVVIIIMLYISGCPFVALLKVTYAENVHIVLSCPNYKVFMFI